MDGDGHGYSSVWDNKDIVIRKKYCYTSVILYCKVVPSMLVGVL